MKNILFFFFLISTLISICGQDLKGKWVELLHDDAINGYAEINIEAQNSNGDVRGYSFDVTKDAPSVRHLGKYIESGRCSYSIEGNFNQARQVLDIMDIEEFFNEGHAPGRMILEYYEQGGKQYLEGIIVNRPREEFIYGAGDTQVRAKFVKVPEDFEFEDPFAEYYEYGPPNEENYLSREDIYNLEYEPSENFDEYDTSEKRDAFNYFSDEEKEELAMSPPTPPSTPQVPEVAEETVAIEELETIEEPEGYFEDEELEAIAEQAAPNNSIPEDVVIEEEIPNIPEDFEVEEVEEVMEVEEAVDIEEELPIEEEIDPLAPNYEQDPITINERVEIEQKYASRDTKTIANIRTQDKILKVVVKDYGEQDGDEISMIVDGKVLYRRLPITTLQKNLEIVLESNRKKNEIIFVAENLGRVPPNTARIELYLNGKKYSYSLLTDTNTNAKIVLLRD